MKNLYSAWKNKNHAIAYNFWNKISNSYFKYLYGSFQENQYLLSIVKNNPKFNILEIGCANGYLKRFLNLNKIINEYLGNDISEEAIEIAKNIYGEEFFCTSNQKDFITNNQKKNSYDIVYSRDTVPHQVEPYSFLDRLLELSKKYLVLRLRTRDFGTTKLDVNTSCQLEPGEEWAPYIVLNYDELISYFKSKKRIIEITTNRSYTILGGQHYRYLEKDLYLNSTKGSETSIILKLSNEFKTSEVLLKETFNLEGHNFIKEKKYTTLFFKILNRIGI